MPGPLISSEQLSSQEQVQDPGDGRAPYVDKEEQEEVCLRSKTSFLNLLAMLAVQKFPK